VIAGLLESADVLATAAALRAFGVRVEQFGPGAWRVIGASGARPGSRSIAAIAEQRCGC
jgi:3-phosphoshikimate 1-carboxyvinyltransferase